MQKLLLDISLAESFSALAKDSTHRAVNKNLDTLAVFYRDILNHYQVTDDEMNASMEWYRNHPEMMDSLYEQMLARVGKLQIHTPR